MGIYVDIDLDYLVSPVRKTGTNNIRLYRNDSCCVENIEEFVGMLTGKGLLDCIEKKFFTNHKKSYTYWWMKKLMNMTLVHIDAHSDLYRNKSSNLTLLKDTDMGCDDYIWYAIRDGYIGRIYWVVPRGLYNLEDPELALKFAPRDILDNYSSYEGKLELSLKVETRCGNKNIEYTICEIDKLPYFENIELITVATSPEFTPEASDKVIMEALKLIGAKEEEINRIQKLHRDMA